MNCKTEKIKGKHGNSNCGKSRRSYSWQNTGGRLGLSDPRSLKKTLHGAGLRLLLRGAG